MILVKTNPKLLSAESKACFTWNETSRTDADRWLDSFTLWEQLFKNKLNVDYADWY